ncbi:MAG: MFS transporter [Ruminococcaceae bacterium]|nr:MFS transporter [Oscillospiraceae bacterium]
MWPICLLFINGTILQGFMLESGITEERVQTFVSVMQIIQCAATVLLSRKLERVNHLIKTSAFNYFLHLPMLMALGTFCLLPELDAAYKLMILFIFGAVSNVAIGISNTLTYKMPYHIIDMRYYGRLVSNAGIMAGISGILFSSLFSAGINRGEYFSVMLFFIALVVMMTISCSLTEFSYQETGKSATGARRVDLKTSLLRYKPFIHMMLPNVLRGFCMGIVNLTVTIGYYFEILDSVTVGYVVAITNVAAMAGYLVYGRLSMRQADGKLILACSVVACIGLSFMLVNKNVWIFLICYGFIYSAFNLVNVAVPAAITRMVEYGILGRFTAGRMMLHVAGGALSGLVCVPMLRMLGGVLTMIIIGVLQLIAGAGYYICVKRYRLTE